MEVFWNEERHGFVQHGQLFVTTLNKLQVQVGRSVIVLLPILFGHQPFAFDSKDDGRQWLPIFGLVRFLSSTWLYDEP